MARLRIECQGRVQDLPIAGTVVSMGRGDENTLVLEDKQASRLHCQIEKFDGGWKIVDLESRNGTKVNGAFVNQAILKNGDRVEVGEVIVTFLSTAGEDTDPSLNPPPAAVRRAARPTPAAMPSPMRTTAPAPRVGTSLRRSSSGGLGTTILIFCVVGIGGFFAYNLVLKGESPDTRKARVAWEEAIAFEKKQKYEEALVALKSIDIRQPEYFGPAQQKIQDLEKVVAGLRLRENADKEAARLKEFKKFAEENKGKPEEIRRKFELFKKDFPASAAIADLETYVKSLKPGGGDPTDGAKTEPGGSYEAIETVANQFLANKKYGEAVQVLKEYIKDAPTSKHAPSAEQRWREILAEAEVFFLEKSEAGKKALEAKKYAAAREAWQAVVAAFGDPGPFPEQVLVAKKELKRVDETEALDKK